MATAAPSPLASSVEKTNGNKLSRLLVNGGTTVLRKTFDRYHPPANLASDLNSNYSILNNLLRKRVLNGHQWDKLFPPGGGVPDSNTFDITLLFLLLTNICGLTPPPSGWHVKPFPGDKSLEANLARVKFFRNALYGHVSSTGVDATSFSSFWQEISITLHSLGLDQSEIDRLRAEQGGEQDYIDALIRWADSEEDIKTQLKDVQQSQTKIQTIVEEVRQTQQEQNEMQKEHQRTLKSTQKAIEDAQQLLVEVLKTHQETQQKHEKDHREIRGDVEERRSEDKESEVLNKKLAVVDTDTVIQNYAKKHEQGTRKSILEKVKLWLEDRSSENRVLVLSGNAGMGKSVIAAVVCKTMDQESRLAGCHFCQHNKARGRKPQVMLQSLARKLCDVLPKYKNVLAEKVSGNLGADINSLEVGELFELLFEESLRSVGDPGRNFLIVIDGLDECEYQSRNELLDVIANHFSTLPVWLRFFVTTRPEINIADRLQKFNPIQLEQDDEENVKDIRLFLERQLGKVIQSGCEEVINELTRKADGHILFAFLMVRFIEENVSRLDLEELRKILPSGVSDVYKSYFDRMEKELKNIEELNISADQLLSFLSAVAAAREPLPLDFVSKLLLSNTKSPAGHRKVRKAIEYISTLLPVQDGCIHFFHKSVKDWLTDSTAYGQHDFSVDEKQGHLALSELCAGELNDVKRRGVHGGEFSDTGKYALQHGVYHMLESEEVDESTRSFEEIVNNYVTDLDVVYAKLCVNNTASSEDIILTQKQEAFQLLSSESQSALSTMWSLLRKHHERLSTRPRIFFQVMVNSGGDMFASKATELLNTKYHEVPYMEYVHKEVEKDQLEEIQAVFRCTSQVACFDISPQWEFMVCECRDGTIQLWSLQTAKIMWKRAVTVPKRYGIVDDHCAFRMVSNSSVLSCYRSVVFHPVKALVLPGTLSHAYSFNGDLLPLFPNSKCRFLVCSINGEKSKMITDSPDDAKCLVMWNLKSGEEIRRATRNEVVLSFAWSPDGKVLAISHISGLICLVDTLNRFATLAEVTLKKPFGMIKFASNLQFLFCWRKPKQRTVADRYLKGIRLNVSKSPSGIFSVHGLDNNTDFEPWVYESCSNSGFLMGDPISCVFGSHQDCFGSFWFPMKEGFAFVLNEQSVIRASSGSDLIVMFRPDKGKVSYRTLRDVAFAVDGKTVYGITERNEAVVSFDVSSGELKAEKQIDIRRGRNAPISRATLSNNPPDYGFCLVPVINGVLLKQRGAAVQLWNFELSRQLRSWSSLVDTYIMPVSDHCVACVGTKFEVSILDTSRGDIVKTISLCHEGYQSTYPLLDKEAIDCNSKYQLLSTDRHSVQLSDSTSILWKRVFEDSELLYSWNIPGILSPTEEFVLISAKTSQNRQEVHVLDASSGATLRILCTVDNVISYAFVSDTECVMDCDNCQSSESLCLRLFSVKTGDLLSVLDMDIRPLCLASFPEKGLIAIGLWQSKRMCAFIKVRMPRDKDNPESKGKQCICFSSNLSISIAKFIHILMSDH